jgi:hypothetical protein
MSMFFNLWYQFLDGGRLSDSQSRTVNFKNAIVSYVLSKNKIMWVTVHDDALLSIMIKRDLFFIF